VVIVVKNLFTFNIITPPMEIDRDEKLTKEIASRYRLGANMFRPANEHTERIKIWISI